MPNHLATLKQLEQAIAFPSGDKLEAWLGFDESIAFLDENAKADSVVLYGSVGHMFLQSALIPNDIVNPPDFDDLTKWHWNIDHTWGVLTSMSNTQIAEPLADSGSVALAKGEPILFRRAFEGVGERASYFELLQRFAHVSGIHHMPQLDAWCRLDQHGDVEEAVKVIQLPDVATICAYVGNPKGNCAHLLLTYSRLLPPAFDDRKTVLPPCDDVNLPVGATLACNLLLALYYVETEVLPKPVQELLRDLLIMAPARGAPPFACHRRE